MTEPSDRKTATIYQFPAGGRDAVGQRRELGKLAADLKSQVVAKVAVGSSWYHEAAIEEADQTRKH